MKYLLSFCYLLIALISWQSCTTKEGTLAFANPTFGGLDVVSTVDSARIFIDGRDSGLKTPALFTDIPSGMRKIEVLAPGFALAIENIEVLEGEVSRLEFDLTSLPETASLEFESDPAGALVLFNDLPVGFTPLTLEDIATGEQHITLYKGGRQVVRETVQLSAGQRVSIERTLQPFRHVLVEHLSNTNCIPCPEADDIIESLLEEVGIDSATSIAYHPNYPGENDPFFLASADDVLPRIEFYGVPPIPFVLLDGIKPSTLFNLEENMRNGFAERFAAPPAATLEILDFNDSFAAFSELRGRIRITALESLGSDVFLRVSLIQRTAVFPPNEPPGTNGDTEFKDILRAFAPSPEGTAVNLGAGETIDIDFDFTPGAGWGEDLHVVAFLQRDTDREILQSVWSLIQE